MLLFLSGTVAPYFDCHCWILTANIVYVLLQVMQMATVQVYSLTMQVREFYDISLRNVVLQQLIFV